MAATKIGVFDSGFGGIDVLRNIVHVLPQYDYVYLGDSARAPYGTRSQDIIYEFTRQAVEYLFKECDFVILACNTASTVALRRIQQELIPQKYPDKKVLGVLIPAVEEALSLTRGTIGLIATEATVASNAFPIQFEKTALQQGCAVPTVVQKATPLLVPIVEASDKHDEATLLIVRDYLQPVIEAGIDTLVLGCTHYGLLEKQIRAVVGPNIKIVSGARVVPEKLAAYLHRHPEIEKKLSRGGTVRFLTTDLTDRFKTLSSVFFGKEIHPEKVTLQ